MEQQRPLAVVTGASAGIGTALAREIAGDGYDLLLVARREDRLRALAETLPTTAHVMALDLTDPDAPQALKARLDELGRSADILINNAGFGSLGRFVEVPAGNHVGMVDLNVRALVALTHLLLPEMLSRGAGAVMNVASTAAFQPGPRLAVYYASKAFVLSFSEALSEEVRGSGVTVSALCPGPTESEFGAVSGMERNRLFRYASRMSSEDVARIGWSGLKRGRRVVITGWRNSLVAGVAKVVPHRLLLPVVSYLQGDA